MVGDVGEVALPAPVRQLVAADRNQPGQPALIEVIGDDALDDPPDGVPGDPQQRLDLALGHLLGAERHQVLEVARVASVRARPRDGLDAHAAIAALHAPQLVLDEAAPAGDIEMPPAPERAVVGRPINLAAARADQPPARERDPHDDPLNAEDDIDDTGARERQQAVKCGGGPHAVLPERSLSFEHQQPAATTIVRAPQRPRRSQPGHRGRKAPHPAADQATADPLKQLETRITSQAQSPGPRPMLSRGTRCIEERQIRPRPRSPHLAEGALRAQRLASRSRDGARRPAFAGPLTADWSRSAWGVLLERADARRLIWPSVCHVAACDRGRLTSARGVVGRGGAGRAEALRVAAEFDGASALSMSMRRKHRSRETVGPTRARSATGPHREPCQRPRRRGSSGARGDRRVRSPHVIGAGPASGRFTEAMTRS